jgi:hypothetical protein
MKYFKCISGSRAYPFKFDPEALALTIVEGKFYRVKESDLYKTHFNGWDRNNFVETSNVERLLIRGNKIKVRNLP